MLKKLLSVLLIVLCGGAGVGAGFYLRPAETEQEQATACAKEDANCPDAAAPKPPEPKTTSEQAAKDGFEFVRLKNQFVVPIFKGEKVNSMVILGLSLEVRTGQSERVFFLEPRLRDGFLQVMFDHAAMGGFDGAFVNNFNLSRLRHGLREKAYEIIGDGVLDVFIAEVARQDM